MNTKITFSAALSTLASALALVAASPVMAASIGDGDPGYPGLVNGEFPEPAGMAKTRAQVKAETLQSIRLGAVSHGERFVFPTQQQLQSIRTAGLEALMPNMPNMPTMATGKSGVLKN